MTKAITTLLAIGVLLVGQPLLVTADTDTAENSVKRPVEDSAANTDPAKALFEQHCVVCHQPHKSSGSHKTEKPGEARSGGCKKGKQKHAGRLALPMPMVKKHYLRTYPQRSDFVEAVTTWIANPQADAAQLDRAVERFGLMPALPLEAEVRKQIASYIYDKVPTGHCPKHQ